MVDAASPLMRGFTRVHRWPVFIGTTDGDQMIVRHGTVVESPVAVDPLVYEAPSPFLMSAIGKAYLTFCPDWSRRAGSIRRQGHRIPVPNQNLLRPRDTGGKTNCRRCVSERQAP